MLLKEFLVSDSLKAISPLDGRYFKSTEPLSDYFSEHALIRYRTKIEIEYLISLSLERGIEELNPFSEKDQQKLRKIYTSFNLEDSKRVPACIMNIYELIRFDTAKNEPAENLKKMQNLQNQGPRGAAPRRAPRRPSRTSRA